MNFNSKEGAQQTVQGQWKWNFLGISIVTSTSALKKEITPQNNLQSFFLLVSFPKWVMRASLVCFSRHVWTSSEKPNIPRNTQTTKLEINHPKIQQDPSWLWTERREQEKASMVMLHSFKFAVILNIVLTFMKATSSLLYLLGVRFLWRKTSYPNYAGLMATVLDLPECLALMGILRGRNGGLSDWTSTSCTLEWKCGVLHHCFSRSIIQLILPHC